MPDETGPGRATVAPAAALEGPPVLEAAGLAKRFGRRIVLADASVRIGRGEMVGVSGGNGSGKSTLLKILAGFLRPDAGTVRVGSPIGYSPQAVLLYDQLTIEEHFRYFAAARRMPAPWAETGRALAQRYRFDGWWRERVETLSEGTRQKLNLALALAHQPELLLLDEPYAGFDWETYLLFWDHAAELRAAGRSLVIVSHLFPDRSRFDRLLRLADGRLEEAPA